MALTEATRRRVDAVLPGSFYVQRFVQRFDEDMAPLARTFHASIL